MGRKETWRYLCFPLCASRTIAVDVGDAVPDAIDMVAVPDIEGVIDIDDISILRV
jgi:hypothetical protein